MTVEKKIVKALTDRALSKIVQKVDLKQALYQITMLIEKQESAKARLMRICIARKYLTFTEQKIIKGG